MSYEYCCKCDEPTGRAGRADDSLYFDLDGPYCRECYEEKMEDDGGETNDEAHAGTVDSESA